LCRCCAESGAEATGVRVESGEAGDAEFVECTVIELGDLSGWNHAADLEPDPPWLGQEP